VVDGVSSASIVNTVDVMLVLFLHITTLILSTFDPTDHAFYKFC
jgi:hypothetical protein